MNIVALATQMTEAVAAYAERVRLFFYEAVLAPHPCPRCAERLQMLGEGRCRCHGCGFAFDPTTTLQRCAACGSKPLLRIRRYECTACGQAINSIFLFDGLIFDAGYFRQKMLESRHRKRERRERVRQMLAECRSSTLLPPPADLAEATDLLAVLNRMTGEEVAGPPPLSRNGFDLKRYQTHIKAHLLPFAVSWEEIPQLDENARNDRIWRFIALLFLAHAGALDIWQDGQAIMVKPNETNREGQELPGDTADADGIQRPMGRAEA